MNMRTKSLLIIIGILSGFLFAFAQERQFPTVKSMMTADEFSAAGLTRLNDRELAALDAWFQKYALIASKVAALQTGKARGDVPPFEKLEGCSIVADDGEFLGLISRDTLDAKSIRNEIGKHGSTISTVSIFNTIGKYGSEISALSAFNEIASKPPSIFDKEGKFVSFLTKNTLRTPRVDPNALVGWLKSK